MSTEQKYYVSGVIADQHGNCGMCADEAAQFWTLYERDAKGLSQGIVDLRFREDAETVMAVYMERDLLRATIIDMNAVLNQKCAIDDRLTLELQTVEAERDALQEQVKALAAENVSHKDTLALLLEDARRVQQLEPNAGTETRINAAMTILNSTVRDIFTPPANILKQDEHLYRLANHIASAKGALPEEWKDWAEEIESDLRRMYAPAPGDDDV